MSKHDKVLVKESTAARMLDLKPSEFRELVQSGHLPRPVALGKHERWAVEQLHRTVSGSSVAEWGEVKW